MTDLNFEHKHPRKPDGTFRNVPVYQAQLPTIDIPVESHDPNYYPDDFKRADSFTQEPTQQYAPRVQGMLLEDGRYEFSFLDYSHDRDAYKFIIQTLKLCKDRKYDSYSRTWSATPSEQLLNWVEYVIPAQGAVYEGDPIEVSVYQDPHLRLHDTNNRYTKSIRLSTPYDPQLKDDMIRHFGRKCCKWIPDTKEWELTDVSPEELIGFLNKWGLTADPAALEHLAHYEQASVEEPTTHTCNPAPAPAKVDVTAGLGLQLFNFQVDGAEFIHQHRKIILADQPGLGKTAQALAACKASGEYPIVVVCPPGLRLNWNREISKVMLKTDSVYVLDKAPKDLTPPLDHDVIVVGYPGLASLSAWLPPNPAHIIFDESHYLKTPTAQRSKSALGYVRRVPSDGIVACLTGTPVLNRAAELANQLAMIGKLNLFGGRQRFLDRYSNWQEIEVKKKVGNKKVVVGTVVRPVGAKNVQELRSILIDNNIMLRRRKDDVLDDLPPKRRGVTPLLLAPAMQKIYDKGEKEVIKSLTEDTIHKIVTESGAIDHYDDDVGKATKRAISSARHQALKDLALSNGRPTTAQIDKVLELVKMGDELAQISGLRQLASACKTPAAIDLIDTWIDGHPNEKLIVFAHHRCVIEALAEQYSCGMIAGGVSHAKRDAIITDFQDPNSDQCVIVCAIDAAGEGITLTASSDIFFVEQPWNPGKCEQAEDRAHRVGQKNQVTVEYLFATNTIDDVIAPTVEKKRKIVNAIHDGDDPDEDEPDIALAVENYLRSKSNYSKRRR